MPDLPLAHAGHYLWTLYIPPMLIVAFAIFRSVRDQRRRDREEDQAGKAD